jgi:hypothetical protein
MIVWSVQTDRLLGAIEVRRHHPDPADRYEDHDEWRVFFSGVEIIGARLDSAFHRRVDLTPVTHLLPGNLIAELRRVVDEVLALRYDVSVAVHTHDMLAVHP